MEQSSNVLFEGSDKDCQEQEEWCFGGSGNNRSFYFYNCFLPMIHTQNNKFCPIYSYIKCTQTTHLTNNSNFFKEYSYDFISTLNEVPFNQYSHFCLQNLFAASLKLMNASQF